MTWGQPGDARYFSPANAPYGITVAGSNRDTDTHWMGSNYRVHFYAPAQRVESASTEYGPTLGRWLVRTELSSDCFNPERYFDSCTSGTSFSSPIVAGLIARFLQTNPSATRSTVMSWLNSESLMSISYQPPGSNESYAARLVNVTD
ncbi:MAG TPA: S8 family serine peptidase [Thermoanaerobaculia bacterium]|nr:S8 family serine peptidase [Thermoanaerobaculia bacterium]